MSTLPVFARAFPSRTRSCICTDFRDSVSLLDCLGGGLEMQSRSIRMHDALLVVSFAPYSREALECARAAKAARANAMIPT